MCLPANTRRPSQKSQSYALPPSVGDGERKKKANTGEGCGVQRDENLGLGEVRCSQAYTAMLLILAEALEW